jgi:hypothetical protein
MKKKIKTSVVVVFASFAAFAATYELDENLSSSDTYLDWTSLSSYKGNPASLPGPGDIVEIPRGMTVKMLAGSDSWELMNTLERVAPRSGSTFIIEVPEDVTAELAVPVTEYGLPGSSDTATLVKRGGGILQFCSYGKVAESGGTVIRDYYLNLEVEEGRLRLYAGVMNPGDDFSCRNTTVGEKGTLEVCKYGRTRLTHLIGTGAVLKEGDVQQRTYLVGTGHSVFEGYISGHIRFDITKGRHDFTCPTNTMGLICLASDAKCGFVTLGLEEKDSSSMGVGNFNLGGSAGVIYLGQDGDTSKKPIQERLSDGFGFVLFP